MRIKLVIFSLLVTIMGGISKDISSTGSEDKFEGHGPLENTTSLEQKIPSDLAIHDRRKGGKKSCKKFLCSYNPICQFIGCETPGDCCIGGAYCCPCPKITKPPQDDLCGLPCSLEGGCPNICPYCIDVNEEFPICVGFSGLSDKAQMYLDTEIADLTSSTLAEFQSSYSECSFFECGVEVMKALYYCHEKCNGEPDCIIPCAKEVLNAIQKCWPCLKKGCCILGYEYCCITEKEVFTEPLKGNTELVIIGGNNDLTGLLSSAEIITSSGVCEPKDPRKIPPLLQPTTAGGLVWSSKEEFLVFCGGSHTYSPEARRLRHYGATSFCYSLKPGDSTWSSVALCGSGGCGPDNQNDMTSARSWFSLTTVSNDPGEILAVGGIDDSGNILDTIEQYSFTDWTWKSYPKKLQNGRFGHCAVNYVAGGKSYLFVIGGSTKAPWRGNWRPTRSVIKIDVASGQIDPINSLPVALWRPACTVMNGNIYVSGGSRGPQKYAQSAVWRYDVQKGKWSLSPIGNLNYARWGHVMGATLDENFGQLIVAGGFNPFFSKYYKSIERSNDGGFMWKLSYPSLNEAREFAGVAAVEPNTFTC